MRSINITFQHGHIYDSETKERVIVEENINYILIFEREEDVKPAKFDKPENIRSEREIYDKIKDDPNVTSIKKLKSAGEHLYFFIIEENENKDKDEHTLKHSWFRITLLEDLFLYTRKDWKSKDLIEGGRLEDCACVVDESTDDTLLFFEHIYAKSVTSAYKKTHIHYFGNAGSPSKNAFDCLYLSKNKDKDNTLEILRGFDESHKIIIKNTIF
ncbi:hypothetical protein AD998_18220 [bacterium 336/3]|nr:hypothetical protein AD998_18220 [bacterium 336/3]